MSFVSDSIHKINLKDKKFDILKKHLLCKINVLENSKHTFYPLRFIPYSIEFIKRNKSFHLCLFDDPHNHPYCIKRNLKLFTYYLFLKIKKNGTVKRLKHCRCDPRFKKYKFQY